ncbi:ferrous iron transport protein B [Burkholderiaceae bacterium DAT-1]|nr:ferrous iron transport protein B [Burkholderiaceae bacterium DAT-1]
MSVIRQLALIGNPNCGKTTLFNQLTGSRQVVGNWPGVTVERKTGEFTLDGESVTIVDLPGLYSLTEGGGVDEAVARDYLSGHASGLILNLLDARQLERQLFLTLQLIELGHPMLVLLGMSDLARKQGLIVDASALSAALGVPVIEVVSTNDEGIAPLRAQLRQPLPAAPALIAYGDAIETAVSRLSTRGLNRADALAALEGCDIEVDADALASVSAELADAYGDDADIAIADARFSAIVRIRDQAVRAVPKEPDLNDRRIDRIALGRWTGIPLFGFVMYLLFAWAIQFGGTMIDAFNGVAEALFVQLPNDIVSWAGLPNWLGFVLGNGIGEGIKTVSGFIPTIACLYLGLGILEDCGYLARAAFVIDRLMRAMGLPGRAFVPMIVGFGCNVPAVMATRTLESRSSRILSSMMIPFISCGARLPVYALFAAVFFPNSGGLVVMSLYLAGLTVALATGLLLHSTLLAADKTPSVMELPAWHWPNMRNVFRQAWMRLTGFITGAGSMIVPMVLVINLLSAIQTEGAHFNPDAPDTSVLADVSRAITPALHPMGINPDNWPATVGVVTGVLAKEVVAGTLVASYQRLAGGEVEAEEAGTVTDRLLNALSTIPENMGKLATRLTDPINMGDAQEKAAHSQETASRGMDAIHARFGNLRAAYAYMLFVLLYTPCVAVLSAMRKEIGLKWTVFSAIWTLSLAWLIAVTYYQLGSASHPIPLLPIGIVMSILVATGLWQSSSRRTRLKGK